jgi:segregation and condensation protein A
VADPVTGEPGAAPTAVGRPDAFSVHLDVFEGPFDLLLQLIGKHQLDVTEVALSQVTDEFIAHIRALGQEWDLGQATEFLVVAATLLDLKAARLLPSAEVEDEEDLALLEARDLLFARLLQYRAYKQAAAHLAGLLAQESHRFPRQVSLEPRYAGLLPEVLLGLGPEEFAALAARALAPRAEPVVAVDHVHGGTVSVREQTAVLRERLRRTGGGSFRALTGDCQGTLEVVARFLGLLELFREGLVAFEQAEALGELHVRWTGGDDDDDEGVDGTGDQAGGSAGERAAAAAGAEWDEPEAGAEATSAETAAADGAAPKASAGPATAGDGGSGGMA